MSSDDRKARIEAIKRQTTCRKMWTGRTLVNRLLLSQESWWERNAERRWTYIIDGIYGDFTRTRTRSWTEAEAEKRSTSAMNDYAQCR